MRSKRLICLYLCSGTVFTGQPTVSSGDGGYWGAGLLPRLGQYKNTLLALYAPTLLETLVFNAPLTHAHFVREGYEEVGGWCRYSSM